MGPQPPRMQSIFRQKHTSKYVAQKDCILKIFKLEYFQAHFPLSRVDILDETKTLSQTLFNGHNT